MIWQEGLTKGTDEYSFVTSDAKWIRVLAGPGTGKSFCLKKRIFRLLENGVKPSELLILTFTNVAADDLKKDIKEVAEKIGLKSNEIEVSTLHSLCRKLLAKEKQLGKNGRKARLLLDFEINTMLRDLEPNIGKVGKKRELLRIYENDLDGNGPEDKSDTELQKQYKQFSESLSVWKEMYGGLLPGELISRMCRYLKGNSEARKKLAYRYVMVDEFQDLNKSEQMLVELLTAEDGCLAVIGDDDQSIYEFKGGSPEGIRKFEQEHPGCEKFSFSMCYRCPSNIVDMANHLIKNNSTRIVKEFKANPSFQPGVYSELSWDTPEEEIDGLRDLIISELSSGLKEGQIVVLTPTRARGKKMQQALLDAGKPTTSCFRDAVFDNEEARNAFSKLSVLANPKDAISWRYLLGGGKGDCKANSCCRVQEVAQEEKRPILDILNECIDPDKSRKIKHTSSFVRKYRELKTEMEELREAVNNDHNGLKGLLCPSGDSAFAGIIQNAVDATTRLIGKDNWLPAIRNTVLQEIFFPEAESYTKKIRVLSLHAAKGLSAPMVVIMSAVDDLLPLGKTKDKVEEQRRLYYVAITRCKGSGKPKEGEKPKYPGKLVVSYFMGDDNSDERYQKSRFLREMVALS